MTSGADFYTGLVARIYGPLRSAVPDHRPYRAFIAASGEPALELGCGDGDPILDLRARGVDVEGLDSSADMLEGCRRAAADRGLEVTLHHGLMETMDLGRRYRSIYLAGPTFNLLADDTAAAQALGRIHAHLEPGGSALIPLFVPELTPAQREALTEYYIATAHQPSLEAQKELHAARDAERRFINANSAVLSR